MFAAFAASIPACASSNTTQATGSTPTKAAAFKNTSGSGFDRLTALPSTIASKYPVSLSSPESALHSYLLNQVLFFFPFLSNSSGARLSLVTHLLPSFLRPIPGTRYFSTTPVVLFLGQVCPCLPILRSGSKNPCGSLLSIV